MSVTLEASDITIELGAASRGKPKPSAVNLVLRNPSGKSAAFKLKSTRPQRYELVPAAGTLPPKGVISVAVTLDEKEAELLVEEHRRSGRRPRAADGSEEEHCDEFLVFCTLLDTLGHDGGGAGGVLPSVAWASRAKAGQCGLAKVAVKLNFTNAEKSSKVNKAEADADPTSDGPSADPMLPSERLDWHVERVRVGASRRLARDLSLGLHRPATLSTAATNAAETSGAAEMASSKGAETPEAGAQKSGRLAESLLRAARELEAEYAKSLGNVLRLAADRDRLAKRNRDLETG
eukprot:CAMPEP_0172604530 /NCGR_PEP_ID=MMETSP1068-20121228/24785_1 /TAXON_ID=35684 /ORGANISM="Pseudopedinella elastica, Strain CCMP716" /LENGTH=291 /DNA_ID=CAMNT_0013406633 /DNA_START=66 /DNA_END=937 /DNA_ORIENTATION=+